MYLSPSDENAADAALVVITVRGQFQADAQSGFALLLAKEIAAGHLEVVVDLETLDLLDLEDVGVLLRARSLLRSRGQHLVVRSSRNNAQILAACALIDPHVRIARVVGSAPRTFSSTRT
jgi:anti-anti-sigma regulatory factor